MTQSSAFHDDSSCVIVIEVMEHTSMMTTRAPCTRSFEALDTKDHQSSMRSPIVGTNEFAVAADCIEPTGTRNLPSHQGERVSSKCTSNNASTIRNGKSKCWGIDSSIQTSIMDIIGDDEPTNSVKERPANEAHVAFSVEGLGDLGSETPKQSPQQRARMSCSDKSSFNKADKKVHFHKNLNSILDDFEMEAEYCVHDTKETTRGNHLDTFLTSEDVLSPLGYTEHELTPVKAGKKLGANRWEMNSFHEDNDTNFWNAGSSFLDDNIINEKCGLNWTNGDANVLRNVSPDFGSRVLQPRSQDDLTGRYSDLGEGDRHFYSLEEPNRHSSLMSDHKQATRMFPYMDMRDKRDLTPLSEESCSSSTGKGWNVAGMPSERHIRRYGVDKPWQFNSSAKENLHGEVQDILRGAMRQGGEYDRSIKYRKSNAGHTKAPYISEARDSEIFNHDDSWLLEEEFPLANADTNPDSFILGSWKNRHQAQQRDSFGTINVQADLPNSSNCRFGIFENKIRNEFSPQNNSFFQPFSVDGSYKESSRGVRHGLNIPVPSSNSADVSNFFGDTEAAFPAPELSAQGSVTEEVGDKLESNPKKIKFLLKT